MPAPPLVHWHFDPVALALGPLQIHWYRICWALAFLVGEVGVRRRLVAIGRGDVDGPGLVISALLCAIMGAHLAHCLFYDPAFYLAHHSGSWQSGKAAWQATDGAVGLVAAVAWAAPRYAPGLAHVTLLDGAAPSAALGGAIIRIANFLNSEIVGKPTSGRWGVVFDDVDAMPRHPVQLYEPRPTCSSPSSCGSPPGAKAR